jgi:hypothetical protein
MINTPKSLMRFTRIDLQSNLSTPCNAGERRNSLLRAARRMALDLEHCAMT